MKRVLVLSTLLCFSSSFPETIIPRIFDFILKYSKYKLFKDTLLVTGETDIVFKNGYGFVNMK
jgi:hypothetical protein